MNQALRESERDCGGPPVGWRRMSLREAGVQLIDSDHRPPPAATTGYPYIAIPQLKRGHLNLSDARRISAEHFIEWTKKARPRRWDVIVSRRCNPGETAVVPAGEECALGQNLVLLRTTGEKVVPEFLRWLVSGPDWWEQVRRFLNVGAVFDSLKCADIPNFVLPIPPPSEQHRIASILGALDDKIELNRRTNETLEAMARALFRAWFVDFEPVRAKQAIASGDLSAEAFAKADPISHKHLHLFPDRLVDTEHGEIPEGWEWGVLGEFAETNSWTLSTRDQLDRIEYVEISEVMRGEIGHIAAYERGEEPSRARRRLRHGDTVLSTVRPDRGAYFLCLQPSPNLVASTGFAVLTPMVPWSFVHAAATQEDVFETLGLLADGGAYPAVSPDVVSALPICAPVIGMELLHAFNTLAEPMFEKANANRLENRQLVKMRDILLPSLLAGDLSVEAGTLRGHQ